MKRTADEYLSYEKKTSTPIHDTETENLFKLLNANNYQKGAWVLHMLRSSLGDEAFILMAAVIVADATKERFIPKGRAKHVQHPGALLIVVCVQKLEEVLRLGIVDRCARLFLVT